VLEGGSGPRPCNVPNASNRNQEFAGKRVTEVWNFANDFGKKGIIHRQGAPMGGLGSGGYYRFGKKDRAEDCLSLDVRRWQREEYLDPGRFFGWAWYQEGREVSSISVAVLRGAAKLSYSIGLEGRKEDFRYTVPLTWTPCNFGGSRRGSCAQGWSKGSRAADGWRSST
jgi:hypothetical protein